MHNNLISGLVKPGDQALISISTILKFSALVQPEWDKPGGLNPLNLKFPENGSKRFHKCFSPEPCYIQIVLNLRRKL